MKIPFSHSKLVTQMAGSTAGAMFFGYVGWRTGNAVPFVAALFCAAGAALFAWAIITERAVLEADHHGVKLNTLVSSKWLPWSAVRDVKVEIFQLLMYGVIPAAKHEHLVFITSGGLFGSKRERISLRGMRLPPGGVAELCAQLQAARAGAPGAPVAPSPKSGSDGVPTSGFDPDAAIARYLANRPKEEPRAVQPRPTFGRKHA